MCLEIFHRPQKLQAVQLGSSATSAQPEVLLYRGLMKRTDKHTELVNQYLFCHTMELRRYFVYAKQNIQLVIIWITISYRQPLSTAYRKQAETDERKKKLTWTMLILVDPLRYNYDPFVLDSRVPLFEVLPFPLASSTACKEWRREASSLAARFRTIQRIHKAWSEHGTFTRR